MSISLQQTRDSTSSEPNTFPIALKFFKDIDVYLTIRESKNGIEPSVLYWDSDLQGNWDDYNWGDDTDYTFADADLITVLNQQNIFVDTLDTQDFIDSSVSTGDWGSASFDYTLTTGEILQSTMIAANNQAYTRATITVEGTNISDDTIYLSANGGTNWQTATNGTELTFTNTSTAGIKYKIVGGATTSIITDIKMRYL